MVVSMGPPPSAASAPPEADPTFGRGYQKIIGPYTNKWRRVSPNGEYDNVDRAWRAQWKADQVLSHNDGKFDFYNNPDYIKARYNIFRRIWQAPMNAFEAALRRYGVGSHNAYAIRYSTTKGIQLYLLSVTVAYYFMYHSNDWEQRGGWKVYKSRTAIYPGHPEWPHNSSQLREKESDYANYNFKHSPI